MPRAFAIVVAALLVAAPARADEADEERARAELRLELEVGDCDGSANSMSDTAEAFYVASGVLLALATPMWGVAIDAADRGWPEGHDTWLLISTAPVGAAVLASIVGMSLDLAAASGRAERRAPVTAECVESRLRAPANQARAWSYFLLPAGIAVALAGVNIAVGPMIASSATVGRIYDGHFELLGGGLGVLAVGAALVVLGLVLRGESEPSRDDEGIELDFAPTAGGAALTARGRF